MKQTKRLLCLAVIGLTGIGISWRLRVRTLQRKPHSAPTVTDKKLENLKQQLVALRAAVAYAPRRAEVRVALADFYRQAGDTERAADQLDIAVRLAPNNRDALLALAAARLSLQQFPKAGAAYSAITRGWPKFAYGWIGLATARYHTGHYLEAAQDAQHAMRLDPGDPNAHIVFATSALNYALQFPDPLSHSGELNIAREELRHGTKFFPNNGQLWYLLARTDAALHHNSERIEALTHAATLLPDHAGVAKELVMAYKAAGDNALALKTVEGALARHPDDSALNDLYGQLLQASDESGNAQKILAAFERAVQQRPEDPYIHDRYGVACVRAGRLEDARISFETATRLNPILTFPQQQLALVYSRLHDPKRAAEAARRARENEIKDRDLSRLQLQTQTHQGNVQFHLALADRYREIGLTGAARDEYLTALDLSKGNARAQQGLRLLANSAPTSH